MSVLTYRFTSISVPPGGIHVLTGDTSRILLSAASDGGLVMRFGSSPSSPAGGLIASNQPGAVWRAVDWGPIVMGDIFIGNVNLVPFTVSLMEGLCYGKPQSQLWC